MTNRDQAASHGKKKDRIGGESRGTMEKVEGQNSPPNYEKKKEVKN